MLYVKKGAGIPFQQGALSLQNGARLPNKRNARNPRIIPTIKEIMVFHSEGSKFISSIS